MTVVAPMILATGAVHSHLVRQDLRTYTSINVWSAGCLDVHYLAVLVGVGATTVNPYLAQESLADRHRRGLCGDLTLEDCVARYKAALDQGLLKVMSKMGISVVSSYRGGYNFEAIGLSRTLVADVDVEFATMCAYMGEAATEVDATFDVDGGDLEYGTPEPLEGLRR